MSKLNWYIFINGEKVNEPFNSFDSAVYEAETLADHDHLDINDVVEIKGIVENL